MNSPLDVGERWSAVPRRYRVLIGTASLIAVAVGTVAVAELLRDVVGPAALRTHLQRFGPYAPLAYVVLQAVQVVVAPVPGQLIAGAGGYLFGGVRATVYSMIGVAVGGVVVFTLTRRVGRPFVEGLLGEGRVSRFEQFGAENGIPTLFVLFLLPTFPDDALCAVAGLWELRTRTFLILLLVGRTPSFYAAAYAGRSIQAGAMGRTGLVLGVGTVVALLVYLARDRIREQLTGENPPVER